MAFDTLKKRLLEALVLTYFNFDREIRVKTDTFTGILIRILIQKYDDGWYPVTYYSEII